MASVVEYDAIVVGAGHNGLTTAAYLAKAGMRTLVLERYRSEGGMTLTEEITLPGFRSDLHSYSHTFVLLSPALDELQLAKYGLQYVFPEPTFISVFPNGGSVYVSRELKKTCKSIERYSKRDAQAWRQLFEGYLAAKPFILQLLLNPPPAFSALLAQLEGLPDGLEVFRNFLLPVRQWCDENFEAEETKVLFGSWSLHASYGPDDAGGAIFTSLITAICQDRGNGLPKGGSMSLSRAIAACARAHGAKIITNARVRKILVHDGEARGVQLADGREFRARRAVVSAVDPTQLFLRLVGEEHLDAGLVRKVRRIAYGSAVASVHFALSGLPKYGVKEASTAAYVHTTPSFDFLTKVMSEARQGLIPEQPWYLATNDAVFDPSRAPPGKGVMKFLVTPLPYEIRADGAGKLRAKHWNHVKEEVADRCQDDWAQYVPSVRRTILKRVVESPVDLEKRISTSVRGTLAGGYAGFHQFWAFRPIPGYAAYRTPIKRLYMSGMGTHPGPGVSTIPGRNTARAVLEDLGIKFETISARSHS